MTDSGQIGRYDPFEDTGDWPFRDAPPRPEEEVLLQEPLGDAHPNETPPVEVPLVEPPVEPAVEEEIAVPVGTAAEAAEAGVVTSAPEPEAPSLPEEPEPASEPGVAEPALGEKPDVAAEHAAGELVVPEGPDVLIGAPHGFRRSVAIVVARYNADITSRMLESAVDALRDCHVSDDAITVVPVPGAFELPLTALALAKTRRYACIVAIGCVIRGETPHFDLISGEAASGLQLAAIETGIPVSFGVLACETPEQAEARIERAADAARAALEMADLFSQVRTRAATA